jgi:hypothetical protein
MHPFPIAVGFVLVAIGVMFGLLARHFGSRREDRD